MKKAFTIFELILVIVIFGIVASIGSDIVFNLYQNYLRTKAINKLETQTELVLDQIAKRLSFSIPNSIGVIRSGKIEKLKGINETYDTKHIWIGKSESYLGGYSGLIDYDSTDTNFTAKTLKSPGSNLSDANETIKALTYNQVGLDSSTSKRPALIFKVPYSEDFNISRYYSHSSDDYTIKVKRKSDDVFEFDSDDASNYTKNKKMIFEQYELAHSAYALEQNGNSSDFNLTLYYNFQPWHGEKYNDKNTKKIVLAEHVSTFRIRQDSNYIGLKLCIRDNTFGSDFNFSACKETAVFR